VRDLGKLLAVIRETVPDATAEEVRAAVRWALQKSKRRGVALETAMRMGCR
jgi:hypothetical protein